MDCRRPNITSDEIELLHFDNIYNSHNPLLSNDSIDYDDASSVVDTSHTGSSSNIFNYRTKEVSSRPKYNHIEPSTTYIGSASVVDSTNVFFGTIFNGPVAIKNYITDKKDVRRSTNVQYNLNSDPLETRAEQLSDQRRIYCARNKRWLIISILASAVLVTTIIAAGHHLRALGDDVHNSDNQLTHAPTEDVAETTVVTMLDGDYEFINRKQYGALASKTVNEPLILPIRRVIISHTATPNCTNYSQCASRVRRIQEFHMRILDWDDNGLNFLVGGDGRAYEGCGYTVGAHTYPYNNVSICIAFIGIFASVEAPQKQLRAAQRIIDDGIKMNKIDPGYVLYGQRQLRNFDSPGVMLYNQIMQWPHWSKEIIPL